MPLTAKQSAFVREYAIDKNASAAAERAGLTADYGRQLLTKSHVQAAIREALGDIDRTKIADATEVRETLTRILRQEVTEDTIAGKDPILFETRPNAASIIRAAKTLGDLEGWFSQSGGEDAGQVDAIARALATPVRPDVN